MPSKENNHFISIVVPLFNERESIAELIEQCVSAFSQFAFELVFVDDGSTDGSFDEILAVAKTIAVPITAVRFRKNCGKSVALQEGFRRAKGNVIVTMDADLQDDPKEAVRLVKKLDVHVDMVIGWRSHRNDGKVKRLVSYIFNKAVSRFTGLSLHDMNSGLKAMKGDVAKEINLYGDLHRFIPVLAHIRGFNVLEIPVKHHARKFGVSKFGPERIFAVFDLISTLFLSGFGSRPLMVFGPPGVFMVALGTVALIYLSILHFMGEAIGTRPLLLLGVLFVIFGIQLLSTGLIGELITSISGKSRETPVAEVISIT